MIYAGRRRLGRHSRGLEDGYKGQTSTADYGFRTRAQAGCRRDRIRQLDVILASVYGLDGRHEQTLDMLHTVSQVFLALRLPIILGGDFNMEVAELNPWLNERYPFLQIVECGPTCSTNQHNKDTAIDYFIVSRQLRPWITGIHTLDTMLKTHEPATMHLQTKDTARQLTKHTFEKRGDDPVIGPPF
jgi:hypothetical protein